MPDNPEDAFATVEEAMSFVRDILPDDEGGGGGALEAIGEDFGRYEGLPPQVALLADGRTANLLAPIAYHRPDGSHWPVPAGSKLDGASIPRAAWTLIGGPFEGKYRDASIVHDRYCVTKDRPWQEVHRMFHDAMRCSGVGKIKANVMFYAVYRFGPKWEVSALEGIGGASASEPLDNAAAESFARDAEAIIEHGLDPDEIEALAEARAEESASTTALEGVGDGLASRAARLVIPGGSGTAKDVAAVVARAEALPDYVIKHFLEKRIRIVACRDSVTDFETSLRGVVPRGWEALGKTWDSVPGSYFNDRKRVVIATIAGVGGRVIPDKASGLHGSDDLVVHESLHGYDYSRKHVDLGLGAFVGARDDDMAGLSDYEKQAGQAGLEETFAETGAQFCTDRAALAQRCPALTGFWSDMPISTEAPAAAPTAAGPAPLGVVTRERDGRLRFDLRAEGPGGAIGHAQLTIEPDAREHRALSERLFGGRDALESDGEDSVLFYP